MKKLMLALMILLSFVLLAACGRNPITVGGGDDEGQGGVIVVTVLDGEFPVSGAMVQLRDGSNATVAEGETDAEGQATIHDVPAGTNYSVIAEKGGVTGSATNLRVSGTEKTLAQIVLKGNGTGGIITGTVKVSESDRPVAGATVEVVGTEVSMVTDNNGQFTLSEVPSGQQKLKISCTGYTDTARDVVVKDGASVPVVVELYPVSAGPRAGHTLIATSLRVIEVDTWHNVTMDYKTKGAGMARFVRQTGAVLVADTLGDKALEFTSNGALSKKYDGKVALLFGGLDAPKGLCRTASGNLLVADSENNRIVELDASDNKVWEYKSRLATPAYAERLANGNTLITDTGNNRVVEVNRSGVVVWTCGNGTTAVLNHPTFATRLPNGNTLVTDTGNDRVMEVTGKDNYVWMYGGEEDGGKLANPGSATRLPNGNTLIADTGNDRVVEIGPESQLQWEMPVGQPIFAERI